MADRWYIMQVYPQFQSIAEYHLARQNFTAFFGTRLTHVTRTEAQRAPLFKGYGFVKFDVDKDQWLKINNTRGVIRLLPRHELLPEPMPEGFVEAFIEKDPITDTTDVTAIFDEFAVGSTVTFSKGAVTNKAGTVVGKRNNGLLLIKLLWQANMGMLVLVPRENATVTDG